MNQIEELAYEALDGWRGHCQCEEDFKDGFLAGFRKAREMAAQWIEEHTQHDRLFVPEFVPSRLRQLGESEETKT